jgi:hypothetical protein
MSDRERYDTLRELFLQARKLKGEKQTAFIKTVQDRDSDLGAELASLLLHDDNRPIMRGENDAVRKLRPKRFSAEPPRGRKRIALIGFLILILLAVSGWWTYSELKEESFRSIENSLTTIHRADIAALEQWIRGEKKMALQLVEHPDIKSNLRGILQGTPDTSSEFFQKLRSELRPLMRQEEIVSVVVTDPAGRIFFCVPEGFTGEMVSSDAMQIMGRLHDEEALFFPPHYNRTAKKERISDRFGPLTWIDVGIRDSSGQMIGTFNIAHLEKDHFSPLIGIAQFGSSGETFAFDRNGFLLSESRFTDELMELGTLPKDGRAVLHLRVTEPESNDLTLIVRAAAESIGNTEITSGFISEPYVNYTGQKAIGAWTWLESYQFGMATEVDYDEAIAGLRSLATGFWVIYLILVAALVGWLGSGSEVYRLRKSVQEQEQLGSYIIEKKIGEGGLGEVYLAHHSLLKRPTALKVLKTEGLPPGSLNRFEKEVMAASRLRHPNTIEIYDYGHTDDGTFYYAMEFLDGLDLMQWVQTLGPFPTARAIHVLKEICRSLKEAHELDLIHRDIKPGNIYLCEMGGIYDQVKVLDFGLVKDLANNEEDHTRILEISGSPHFMAPERIHNPLEANARVDIYALGGIGYYLMSGHRPLETDRDMSMIDRILDMEILSLAEVTQQEVPPALVRLIDQCLLKDPEKRPQDVVWVFDELNDLAKHFPWSQEDAAFLWENSRHLL